MFAKNQHVLSKSGFGMCVCLYFVPSETCLALLFSGHAQTSAFPTGKLGAV